MFRLDLGAATAVAAVRADFRPSRSGSLLASLALVLGAINPVDSRAATLIGLGDFPGGNSDSRAFGISANGLVVVGKGSGGANGAFRWTQADGMKELAACACMTFPGFFEAYAASEDGSEVVGVSRALNGEAVRWTLSEDPKIESTTKSLGDLPGGGSNPNSSANDVSADGQVVVGFGTSDSGREAFRWTSAGDDGDMSGLGDFAGGIGDSSATAVSKDGLVVVGYGTSSSGRQAFRWTSANGMVGLGDLAGGSVGSQAFDVSPDGSVVVGISRSGLGDEAFRWTQAGGMVALSDLPGGDFGSEAHGASENGEVVVGAGSIAGASAAFYWTQANGMQNLLEVLVAQGADVTGWDSLEIAYDVSPDGSAIVGYGYHNGFPEAFLAYLGDATPGPDNLFGTPGNDTLDGKGGADVMTGLAGDDTYIVDNTGDSVVEVTGEGVDTVKSSVTYTLLSNTENLILTGSAAINGNGNSLANTLTGNSGNNQLNGKIGADVMKGMAGNDIYYVDNIGDKVTEGLNQGTDTIRSSISRALPTNVENLTLTGSAAINGNGNSLANTLTGNSGNNQLNGKIGADVMKGMAGNDIYYVDNIGDKVTEGLNQGTDTIRSSISRALPTNVEILTLIGTAAINGTGNTLANKIFGNGAANTLNGKESNDTLTGGAGGDRFLFATALNGSTNFDRITDFNALDDTIRLENAIFMALTTTGTLAASAFTLGIAASTAEHRIIYDQATGYLYYDQDGTGAAAKVRFAFLTTKPALTNADFWVQ